MGFNNIIRNCGLLELFCLENTISWQGGRGNKMVRCRLDKALANEDWHTLCPCSLTENLGLVECNHIPIIATIEDEVTRRREIFRFDKGWIKQECLLESITPGWFSDIGRPEQDFVTKLSNCRHEISRWKKNNPPYGKKKISELQKALDEVKQD